MGLTVRFIPDAQRFERMNTQEIRDGYLIGDLSQAGKLSMVYTDIERTIIGLALPAGEAILLENPPELASACFTERREVGVINIGGPGRVKVDGTVYSLANRDALYIGCGKKEVWFDSEEGSNLAKFYLVSYPAHREYPTAYTGVKDAEALQLGSAEASNKRTIYKYIYPGGIRSCQLVMGFTELAEGSVWNTMPAHRHMRRSEVYMYFNLPGEAVVFHLMGKPDETRNIVVRDCQAVISPGWSIHAGSGTQNYSFVWAMGGENQDFTDMDPVALTALR